MNRTPNARSTRVGAALVAAALTAAGLGATTAGAIAPAQASGPHDVVLPERMRGEAAIQALGSELPEVAARNGMPADELRRRLRADDALWLDPAGALLFVDDALAEPAGTQEPVTGVDPVLGSFSTADAFTLHSRPGAARVVHLDFDGHSTPGGAWKGTPGAPYDLDGQPGSFSDTERRVIIDVWRHVAEDFAPLAIDVTTEDPGIDAIRRTDTGDASYGTRVVVTPTRTDCASCGGVAYVGTYDITGGSATTGWTHDHYQPAWVYIAGSNAKHIAEAASHEAGHNLGLSHDGVTGGSAYYEGHGDWAPIMGVGYYRAITQWSRGEYAGANNTEDDFAVMAANGGVAAGDDHGHSTPTPLGGPAVDVSGVLGHQDVDAFHFTAAVAGTVDLAVAPAPVGADADLRLRIVDGAGATVALADPAGLAASLQLTVAAGTYTVLVEAAGAGDPRTTGYSSYGSLGRYRLTGSIPAGDAEPPTPAPGTPVVAASVSGGTVSLSWADVAGESAYEVYRETRQKNGSYAKRTLVRTLAADVTATTDAPGSGTFRYQVVATGPGGSSPSTFAVVTVSGSSGSTKPGKPANTR